MDKTYAETQNQAPFDWNKYLNERIAEHSQLPENWHEWIKNKAGMWTTCGCGNQCAIIPRRYSGEPCDLTLARLGMEFWFAVCDQDWEDAIATLQEIEKRSAVVIQQTLSELNAE